MIETYINKTYLSKKEGKYAGKCTAKLIHAAHNPALFFRDISPDNEIHISMVCNWIKKYSITEDATAFHRKFPLQGVSSKKKTLHCKLIFENGSKKLKVGVIMFTSNACGQEQE